MSIYIRRYKRATKTLFWKFSGNLGDDMNPILVEYISGSKCKQVFNKNTSSHSPIYLVIGTVLHWADENTVVWGAGFGSDDACVKSKPLDICAVRGPLTRKRLAETGIQAPEIYGDPALLFSKFYNPAQIEKYDIGFIPHYSDARHPLVTSILAQSNNVRFIDVTNSVNTVIDQINQCKVILSSSLHGVIVAHTYGIRALHISFEESTMQKWFKFHDYFQSVGLNNYSGPVVINKSTTIGELEKLANLEPKGIEFDTTKLLDACPFLPT